MTDLKHQTRLQISPKEEFTNVFPDIQKLPDLSLANVKEFLKIAFPLPVLTKSQAVDLVLQHLNNRIKATQARQKKKSYKNYS